MSPRLKHVVLGICAAGLWVAMGQNPPGTGNDGDPGIPAFLTAPIHSRVAPPGLKSGHFTFEEGGQTPPPFNQNLGAADYRPAPHGAGTQLVGSAATLVSNDSVAYEGETGAAASASRLVAGSNHIYPGNCSASALPGSFGDCAPQSYTSTDGLSWTNAPLPRIWNGTTFGIGFDPAIDYDNSGNFYFSYGVAPLSGSYPNAIVMVKSNNGQDWTQLTPVTFNTSKNFDDKYWLAVDRSDSAYANRIYVTWDRNQSINQILYVAYSSDGGQTWSSPIKVNDGTSKFERVIGAYPAVDQKTGDVYVSWHDYARNIIFVDRSTDGGVHWGTDHAAATTHAGFGTDIGCVGGRSQGPAHHLKVGPSGKLYLVYADNVTGRGYDILLTTSTNGGVSWSSPVTLNDDSGAADQFHPTLSVTSNGSGGDIVTVTFYDRRDDPSNCLAHVYAVESTDSGQTWSANVKLTTAQSDFDGNPNGPGDYSSSTPSTLGRFPFFCVHPPGSGAGAFDIDTVNVTSGTSTTTAHDVGVDSVNAPSSAVVDILYTVEVTVQNFGAQSETFNVSLSDTLAATIGSVPTVSLGAGATTTVSFNWTPTTAGGHSLTASTTLGTDTNSANDSQTVTSNVSSGSSTPAPTVSGIDPNKMNAGTSVSVTIGGSNFVSGATVSFQNGIGPAPAASSVLVNSGSMITATVTAPNGGPKGDRVWDVRVTNPDGQSGVLPQSFTVTK